ncbi:MAG: hypothetical protein U0610_03560 [bacterium]
MDAAQRAPNSRPRPGAGARARLVAGVVGTVLACATSAHATFHLMRITQVYAGDVTHPDAQFVELRMCTANQNLVDQHPVTFYSKTGAVLGSVSFGGDLAHGASQSRVLVATSSAEAAFHVSADLRMPADLVPSGGKVCFDPSFGVDCIAWGNYSNLPDAAVGTPFAAATGLLPGVTAVRDLAVAGGATTLECAIVGANDDTDDSAADFDSGAPSPGNNAGVVGDLDAALVFVHGFEAGALDGWSASSP